MLKDILGYIGAVSLTFLFIPQVYQTYKSKDTKNISVYFLFLEIIASVSFIWYGSLLNSIPIIIANSSALICAISLIIAKCKYDKVNETNQVDIGRQNNV